MDLDSHAACIDRDPSTTHTGRASGTELLVVGCCNGSIKNFSPGRPGNQEAKDAHEGAVIEVKFSPDGSMIASCGEDGKIKIWSLTKRFNLKVLSLHPNEYFEPYCFKFFSKI